VQHVQDALQAEREEYSRATRRAYYEQEEEQGPRLRADIRHGFAQADARSWSDLLSGRQVEVSLEDSEESGLLEGTTAETTYALTYAWCDRADAPTRYPRTVRLPQMPSAGRRGGSPPHIGGAGTSSAVTCGAPLM